MRYSRSTVLASALATVALINPVCAAKKGGDMSGMSGMNMNMSSTDMSMMNSTGGMAGTQSTSTPNGMVMMHVVQVSDTDGAKKFNPDTITANPGDMVQFHFYPMSHSVAQSTFANPCQPLSQGNASASPGFWSGFMPVTAANKTMPVFTITVNDTNPIWFYCATAMHCQMGMSGVINPPKGKTAAMYQKASINVAKSGVPGVVEGGVISTNTTTNGNLSNNPGSDIGGAGSASGSGSSNGSPSSTSSAGAASQSKSGGVKTTAMGSAMALVGVAVAVVVIG